ncbi:MAG TPA: hypothetical protein VNM92_10680 [Thermoanaerobaculia bacterium]|nr:hypothetical protein [Thermoanaerobaculia bacterium]
MRIKNLSKSSFIIVVVSSSLLLSSCGSSRSTTSTESRREARAAAALSEPEIFIQQLSRTPVAARHVTGPLPVNFRVSVRNNSSTLLTLTRVRVESMGEGAYTLTSNAQAFNKEIEPARQASVEFWAPATAETTITGSNGPVTIRGIAYFKSATGAFQKVFVQQVHDQLNRGVRSGVGN